MMDASAQSTFKKLKALHDLLYPSRTGTAAQRQSIHDSIFRSTTLNIPYPSTSDITQPFSVEFPYTETFKHIDLRRHPGYKSICRKHGFDGGLLLPIDIPGEIIIILEDYEIMRETLEWKAGYYFQKKRKTGFYGTLNNPKMALLGNPGIGKTTFLLYLLVYRMTAGLPLVWCQDGRNHFLVSGDGVRVLGDHEIYVERQDHLTYWYLLDGHPPANPYSAAFKDVVVQAANPYEDSVEWTKKLCLQNTWMDLWSYGEFFAFGKICLRVKNSILWKSWTALGGIPRLLRHLQPEQSYSFDQLFHARLELIKSTASTKNFWNSQASGSASFESPAEILMAFRPGLSKVWKDANVALEVKRPLSYLFGYKHLVATSYIGDMVLQNLPYKSREKARVFLSEQPEGTNEPESRKPARLYAAPGRSYEGTEFCVKSLQKMAEADEGCEDVSVKEEEVVQGAALWRRK